MSGALVQSQSTYTSGRDINITTIQTCTTSNNLTEKKKVVDWLFDLAAVNHYAIQADTYARLTPGTAAWITQKPEFGEWMSGGLGTLWGVGIPGAGKTFMSSFIINYLHQRFEAQGAGEIILFAFSRFNDKLNVSQILATLLGQLVDNSTSALSHLFENLYTPCINKKIVPAEEALAFHLKAAIGLVSARSFILIDALDELQDNVRESIISILLGINCSRFLTSRELLLESLGTPNIHIQAPDNDFRTFITHEVQRLPKLWSLLKNRADVLEEMIQEIMVKSDGMFLLAALQLSTLGSITNIRNLRKAVNSLPSTLTSMYKVNLERIMNQEEEEHLLACRAILWVTYAGRFLKTTELLEALAVESDSTELDPEARTNQMTLKSVCCGLLTIEERTDTVKLIHYTTYAFFMGQKEGLFKSPHTFTATICAVYLNLSGIYNKKITNIYNLDEFATSRPLAIYACRYIGHHTSCSIDEQDNGESCIKELLSLSPLVPLAPVYWAKRPGEVIHYGSITHFAALHGIFSWVKACHEGLNDQSQNGGTPFLYASMNGHLSIMKWILDEAGFGLNEQNSDGQTALHVASSNGHAQIVKLLLGHPGINVNTLDKSSLTPLHCAAIIDHEAVVQCLLACPGIDINAQDENGSTALYYACFYGHEAIAKLLLVSPGIDVNRPTRNGASSSFDSQEPVMQQLLHSPGININTQDMDGNTCLYLASCCNGRKAVVQQLLGVTNLDTNFQHFNGYTALQAASFWGHQEIAQVLVDYPGIDVNKQDRDGFTALHHASLGGHEGVVWVLLHHPDISIGITSNQGDTALTLAQRNGHEDILELFSDSPCKKA